MGDGRRMRRVGQGADGVEAVLVADGDPLVLAQVLVPGGDDELLDDPVRVGGVLPDPPGARPGAAPAEPGRLERGEQLVGEPLAGASTRRSP